MALYRTLRCVFSGKVPPTSKQLALARSLDIKLPPNASKEEVSRRLDQALDAKRQANLQKQRKKAEAEVALKRALRQQQTLDDRIQKAGLKEKMDRELENLLNRQDQDREREQEPER